MDYTSTLILEEKCSQKACLWYLGLKFSGLEIKSIASRFDSSGMDSGRETKCASYLPVLLHKKESWAMHAHSIEKLVEHQVIPHVC